MERILGLRRAELARRGDIRRARALSTWARRSERCCTVFRSAWAASHAPHRGLQGKSNITLELKEEQTVIIHGLTYWPLPRLSSEPAADFDNVRPRSWSPV